MNKIDSAYKSIGEVAKLLNLVNKMSGKLNTHTIRYWEKQFKQIKPHKTAGKRRFYSRKDFKIIKMIKFLLKERGLTINGVKKILNSQERQSLDDNVNLGINKQNLETANIVKTKIKKISKIIKEIKSIK